MGYRREDPQQLAGHHPPPFEPPRCPSSSAPLWWEIIEELRWMFAQHAKIHGPEFLKRVSDVQAQKRRHVIGVNKVLG